MAPKRLTQLKVVPSRVEPPLGQAVEIFLLDCRARRLSARTIEFYDWQLGKALEYLTGQGVESLGILSPTHLRSYLIQLQERGLSDSSQHAAARALRAWLNFCVSEELITDSPMRKVRMPKRGNHILPALTPEDVHRLLRACRDQRETALVLFMLDTGVRAAELCALNIEHVNLKTGEVSIKHGKGDKGRTVFMGAKSHKALRKFLFGRTGVALTDPLFPSQGSRSNGERLTTSGLQQLLRRLGKRAGVAECHPHTFRRSFALWSLRSGMDLISLSRIIGHADLSVLRKYLDQAKEDLADAHRQHGAVDTML